MRLSKPFIYYRNKTYEVSMTKQEFIKTTEKRLFPILYNLMRQYDTLSFLQDFGMYLRTEIEKTYKRAERVGFKEYMARNQFPNYATDVTENDKECAKYYDTIGNLERVEKEVDDLIMYLIDQFGSDYV